jgi:hypothetical protein
MNGDIAPRRRSRSLVAGPLELTPDACSASEQAAERAVIWALDLLHEDELALIAEGAEDKIAFGRWLTRQRSQRRLVYDVLRATIPQLVRGLVRARLTPNYTPHGRFTQVSAVAAAAQMDRTVVFDEWAPRALLLVHLAHAYLVSVEDQPRLASLTFYSDADFGGPEASAYGLHRVSSDRTISRLAGLAGLGADVLVPHSCLPYAVGLRCDPAHPQADHAALTNARAQLTAFGVDGLPSSHADHLDVLLRIATSAREVLQRARTRSVVCGSAGVDPSRVLERAFPRWLTIGPLPSGVHDSAPPRPAETQMPGADPTLLQLARRHGMWPLYVLFDTADFTASARSLQDMIFCDGQNEYSGRQFIDLVCSPDRSAIPGLRREPEHALRSLRDLPELAELGIHSDAADVDWLWHRDGLRLLQGRGQGIVQGLLVRASQTRTTGYVVMSDLADSALRANAIARADLHHRSTSNPTHSHCISRVFDDYELHALKTWKFSTRAWLRVAALLSNSPIVGIGRRLQTHPRLQSRPR